MLAIVAVLENTLSNPVTASPQKFMAFFSFFKKINESNYRADTNTVFTTRNILN